MRSFSVGVAGVLISGVVLTSATVATANSSESAPTVAPQSEATLAAFELSQNSLISTLGAPKVVVPSVDLKAEAAAKKAAAEQHAAEAKIAAAEKADIARQAAEKVAAETAQKAEKAAGQKLSTAGATVESTQAPQSEKPAPAPASTASATPQATESATAVATQQAAPAIPSTSAPAAPVASAATQAPVAKAATQSKPAAHKSQQNNAPTLSVATNSAKRNAVVAAAKQAASVNAQTDCTALVSNSLAAIGVNFHGWPADYQSLGTIVSQSQAQPGDIIYYQSNGFGSSHVALYIGNGQAVHGGWNGMGTSVFSVNLPTGSAPIFISPSAYNG